MMQSMKFELDPVKFLARIIYPKIFINHISISKLEVSLSKNYKNGNIFHYFKNNIVRFQKSDVSVFIDEIIIKNNIIDSLKILNANITIKKDHVNVDAIACVLGISTGFNLHFRQMVDGVFDTSSTFTFGNSVNMIIGSKDEINLSSSDVNQSIMIEKFKLGSSRNNFIFNSINLGVLNFNLGDFSLLGTKNHSEICDVIGYTSSLEKKIKITHCKNGNYELRLVVKNKVAGMIRGNVKTGEIVLDVRNINTEDIPIIPFVFKDIRGVVSILGSMNRTSGLINFKFEKLSSSNVNVGNMEGSITRDNNLYLFKFFKDRSSVILKTVVDGNKVVSANFKFNDINISEIFHASKCPRHKVTGKISGYINYKKNALTKFDIKSSEITLYDNRLKGIEVSGDIMDFSKMNINVRRFILKDNSGKLLADVAGMILFKKALSISSIYINMKKVYIGGVRTTGCLRFQNGLSNDNKIKGVIKSDSVKVSGVSFENVVANAEISFDDFKISDLRSDNGVKGTVLMNFKKNKLSGNFCFKNTNIGGIYPGLYGVLSSIVKFSGKLTNPDIDIATSLTKGMYLSKFFSFSSKLTRRSGVVTFDAILSADKTKVTIKKDCLRNGTFLLTVDNLTEKIMGMFLGFKIPINRCFSGNGIFTMVDKKYNLKMSLKAKNSYVETFGFNDVKFDIEMSSGNIIVNNASAKILDGEIKIDKGFFNIKGGRYGLNLSLLNVHIGPIDLFGNFKLFGETAKGEKGSMYHNGRVDLSDLWINGYHLSCFHFNYTAKDKILEFFHRADSSCLCDCSGLIVLGETMPIKKFNILKGKSSFSLNVDSSGDYINLKSKGSNIDWDFITNILNLPIPIKGNACVNVSLLGNINNPKGDVTITSANGSIMEIPYDSFDVEIGFLNNIATLKKVVMIKLNEISVHVRGSLPFWFNKALVDKVKKKYIDVFYDIEDNKLNILKYLSKGFVKYSSGRMFLKGHVGGTYEKVSNNAKLLIIGGAFELKNYIDRVRNMSVEMSISENFVRINRFDFKSGHGKLNICGQIGINNFRIKDFDVRFVTDDKGIHLCVMELPISSNIISYKYLSQDYSVGEPCFDIKIRGTPEKPKVSGSVLLKNTRFTFPEDISCKNKSFIFPKDTEFDLELKTSGNTKFENSFISAFVRGSLFIKGFYNDIEMRGIIESSNGVVDCLGYRFNISNAKMEIIDDGQIYITAECETSGHSKVGNGSENVKLIIPRCNMSNPRFYLNRVDQKKKFGRAVETEQPKKLNLSKLEPSLGFEVKRHALHLIDQNITAPFARIILRKIRLADNFKVSYVQNDNTVLTMRDLIFAELFWGTKYSMEKNLTDKILVGYSIIFNEFNKNLDLYHEIGIKYKVTDDLSLSANCGFEVGRQPRGHTNGKLMFQYQVRF
ncbi:MAG: translocation/assembly module TamB [Endomicrobium sp.]|nr:translocation/assembly module TamB [Endomicrobium sp.]